MPRANPPKPRKSPLANLDALLDSCLPPLGKPDPKRPTTKKAKPPKSANIARTHKPKFHDLDQTAYARRLAALDIRNTTPPLHACATTTYAGDAAENRRAALHAEQLERARNAARFADYRAAFAWRLLEQAETARHAPTEAERDAHLTNWYLWVQMAKRRPTTAHNAHQTNPTATT